TVPPSVADGKGLCRSVRRRTVFGTSEYRRGGEGMGEATTDPVRLPPGPRIPKLVTGVAFLTRRHRAIAALGRRYGSTFSVKLPIFGESVVVSDPVLVKDLF